MTSLEAVRLVSAAMSVAMEFSISLSEIQAMRDASGGHLTDEQERQLADQAEADVESM